MSDIIYRKSQVGWILIVIMPLVCIFMALSYVYELGSNPLPFSAMIILIAVFLFIMLIFFNLTIFIQDRTIHAKYGIGLIHIKIRVDELHEASIVKTPWWYGWGIRVTPQGMLYNIYGKQAVKIKYTGKGKTKTVMLGSAEPEKLLEKVNQLK